MLVVDETRPYIVRLIQIETANIQRLADEMLYTLLSNIRGTQGPYQNFHSTLVRDYLIEPIKKMRQLCSDLLVYSSLWFADKDDSDYDIMVCTAQLLHFTVLSYAGAYTCPLGTEHTGQEIEKFDFPRRVTYSDPALEALFFRRQSATNLFSQESVTVYGPVSRQCQTMGVLTECRHCWGGKAAFSTMITAINDIWGPPWKIPTIQDNSTIR